MHYFYCKNIYGYFLLMQKLYILDIDHFYFLNIKIFDYKINHRSFFSLNEFINLLELSKTFSIRYCKLFKFCKSSFLYNLKILITKLYFTVDSIYFLLL